MANPSSSFSSSSQFTYSSDPSYFPTPFHLQQPPYVPPLRPPPPTVAAAPAAAAYSYPPPPSHHHQFQLPRCAAGQTWEDPSLAEWPENDHRLFCGDLGNEVNDDVLSKAFTRFPSFNMARVVRDKRSVLSRGGEAVQMTTDHEPNTERGIIENRGGFVSNMPVDKPPFYGLSCAQLSGFYLLFTHLFILFAWFYICLPNYVL
ncbi:RNA-binding protein [Arachis hypogaea]|nr:RNA-binding protein [Arachis hypogaea]